MTEARIGRPPSGVEIVESLEGSELAKARLKTILRTIAGELTIPQASHELGICPSRFHVIREETLQHSLQSLEPKPSGRPSSAGCCKSGEQAELRAQLDQSEQELALANVRLELAAIDRQFSPDGIELKKTRRRLEEVRAKLQRKMKRNLRRRKRLGRRQ